MTLDEFKKGDFKQVRRININIDSITSNKVYNVKSKNLLECLVQIDLKHPFGDQTWIRYENLEIITTK
jgi:hypothetical protein